MFDEKDVVAVMFPVGWMPIKRGTYVLTSYGWSDETDSFEYKTDDGAVVIGPVTSVLAVKTRKKG